MPIKSSPCNTEIACLEIGDFNNWKKSEKKKISEAKKLCGALGGLQGIYILDAL